MFARVALRSSSRVALAAPSVRCFGDKGMTAYDALSRSGYNSIDYTIQEDATVYDAVHKFAAFNIGCLVTVDGGKYLHGSNRWLMLFTVTHWYQGLQSAPVTRLLNTTGSLA